MARNYHRYGEGEKVMALKPQEAFRRGQERFLRQVIELESVIDLALDKDAYNAANSVSKSIHVPLFLKRISVGRKTRSKETV